MTGAGHEALHHIPGDDYRRPAARVTGRQWRDAVRSFFHDERSELESVRGCGGI